MNDDTSSQVKASSANLKQQFSDFNFRRDTLRYLAARNSLLLEKG